ncbi:unnamed protein product [Rotaria magnacalcarata]|uniref:TTF-type domain-containing protein n=1 Tax=Rotaria magnacalcarata TaxID=392030 RepID=A0A819ZB73_9BILA|nr:unnamed protein product [Rotaria magnacalcarata]
MISTTNLLKLRKSFTAKWYDERPWLEYSIKTNSCCCYFCRHFSALTTSSQKKPQTDAFVNHGFQNWKRALDKSKGLDRHAQSQGHILTASNFTVFQERGRIKQNVVQLLDKNRIEKIRRNQERLTKIASVLLLCARQSIGIRGHDESENSLNKGNFIEMLKWASSTDPIVKSIFEESTRSSTYLSPAIQNELIKIMAEQIKRQIAEKIKGQAFALMADENRDNGGHEQLSIVIRRVVNADNHKYIIQKYFIGLIRLHEFDAQTLSNEIVNYLTNYGAKLDSYIAQCYDGASVMSGKCSGVQAILRQNHMPNGIHIHCHVHRLNLVIVDVTKHIDCDQSHLFNEIQVLKQMLENKKLSSIAELYQHMKSLEQAFQRIMSMVKAALTIPVSSSTCERVFSKMHLIKTRIQNSMTDERLGDLCILSIEHDCEINFEQVIDQFSVVHKNSRIMLR